MSKFKDEYDRKRKLDIVLDSRSEIVIIMCTIERNKERKKEESIPLAKNMVLGLTEAWKKDHCCKRYFSGVEV